MLEQGKVYKTNGGIEVRIGGRIKEYSKEQPFVWSIAGNWYHEETGAFITIRNQGSRSNPVWVREPLDIDSTSCIKDHTIILQD